MTPQIGEMIHHFPLFSSLPPEEIDYLAASLHSISLPAGAILFTEGDPGDRFSIILKGEIEIVKALGTEGERILAVVGEGEFLGEMSLLYRDRQRSASARARCDATLLELTHAEFDALLKRRPDLAFFIMQEMSQRLRKSEDDTVRDLLEKNRELSQAYDNLKAAQARLLEQERTEHELRMARRIQEGILPKEIPTLPGWQLAARWEPARAVSGDFYDFIPFPNGTLAVILGDVTDKGVPAALVMAITRSALRAAALNAASQDGHISPGSILATVNELLIPDIPPAMFVTCFLGILDPTSGEMRFANAGQDLPYLRSEAGVREVRATGMPLGLMPGMIYEERAAWIEPGDRMLLYSDGLVEAHNSQGEMFGFPRLQRRLAEMPLSLDVESMIGFFLEQLTVFTGPAWEQEDDVTLVVLERRTADQAPPGGANHPGETKYSARSDGGLGA